MCNAMLQRQRTYQAKKYVPVVSAALDPYEEERNSLVDDERLDKWFRYVDDELRRYRSPFVAAEALLSEMRVHHAQLYQPERIYVNTALRVLRACVPLLPKETAEAASAAIHELLPCLVYTRRIPLATSGAASTFPSSSPLQSSKAYSEQVTQLTYVGAFRRMLARWDQLRAQLTQQERQVRVEVKVMDRLVHELDHMWVKTCFYSWHTYCRQLQMRKAQLRRRLVRATANGATPRFLRAWRQYAHTIALNAKTSRTNALQQQVEALYPLEQAAKSRHDHFSEEVKEMSRLAGESLQRLEETQDRLRVLEELITETQLSLADHWSTWKECVHLLFGDVGKLPTKPDRAVRIDYLMNITDTASSLEKRARTKAARQGVQNIGKLLLYENALGICPVESADGDDDEAATAAEGGGDDINKRDSNDNSHQGDDIQRWNIASHPSRRTAPFNPSTLQPSHTYSTSITVPVLGTRQSSTTEKWLSVVHAATNAALAGDVNRVYAAVAAVAGRVLSPLHLTDVLHHNEPQLNLTIAFLSTLYSGGHCSLFMPALLLSGHTKNQEENEDLASVKAASAAATTKALQGAQDGDEVHWGALMVQDVSTGMRKVQRCTDANERYLLAVRQCMMSSELEVVQGYLEDLYARFATTGVPLSQAKLESVWKPIVSPMELPIIKALYPTQGILSFAELVNYVTRVAEFSGRPLLGLVERLDATYPYDPLDELHIFHHSEEAVEIFHEYAAQITLLFGWLKDEATAAEFRSDHLTELLEEYLGLSAAEIAEVCDLMKQEGGGVVGRDHVEWLLLVATSYVDPSPFSSLLEKIENVFLRCLPLFADLGMMFTGAVDAVKR